MTAGIDRSGEPVDNELDELFEQAKNMKSKCNLTAEEMDELNERLFK